MRKILNENLPILTENWEGNPLDAEGRYKNLHGKSEKTYKDLFKWQLSKNPFRKHKKNQKTNVEVLKNSDFLSDKRNGFTWLGHATFVFTLNEKNIIIDPVFGKIGPLKRYTEFPCSPTDLIYIDIILLSHNHRDHLDEKSIKQLCNRNPQAVIYTTLGISKLLRNWSIKNEIIEAGWYQQFKEIAGINISLVPSKHWSRRGLFDLNEMLWGGFMIQAANHCLYFAGDSGIDDHFTQIGKLFPKIDYAFIGIGAYEPNWFMRDSHTNPAEAVECQRMLKASKLFPMHYGTFDLSDEPIFLPKEALQDIMNKEELANIIFGTIGKKVLL
ncbi:L-ascorbate metabolism protein UlaG (beta-lactamase superfamily) [Pedobacter sp. UYP30]|uniref:MBL fold metallo-hydrolase n=1 Tax=Pedobacter sp. UYP30 TaxID=1756400 RepID=UPI003397714C